MTDDIRDKIESREEEATTGPRPEGWEQLEEAASQAEQQAKKRPGWTEGQNIEAENVPEDERLRRPVGTESDSY